MRGGRSTRAIDERWRVRASLVLCHVSLCLSWVSVAQAQEGGEQMNAEQVVLLNSANKELGQEEPRLERAQAILEQALEAGPRFDLLWLTYGRVLQKQDRCAEAIVAFDAIATAPHEPTQSREDIDRILAAYREQIPEICSGRIRIECDSEVGPIAIDEEVRTACDGEVAVEPGVHRISYQEGASARSIEVDVKGGQVELIKVGFIDEAQPLPVSVGRDELRRRRGKQLLWGGGGLVAAGMGVATFGVVTGFENIRSIRQGEVTQAVGRSQANRANGLLIAGGVLGALGVGVTVAGLWLRTSHPDEARVGTLQLFAGPRSVNLSLTF